MGWGLKYHSLCPVGFVSFLRVFLCMFYSVYVLFLFSKWVCTIIWGNRNKWRQGKDWQQKAGVWGSRSKRWLWYEPSGQRFISAGRVWQAQERRRRERRYEGSGLRCRHRCSLSKCIASIEEANWDAEGKRRGRNCTSFPYNTGYSLGCQPSLPSKNKNNPNKQKTSVRGFVSRSVSSRQAFLHGDDRGKLCSAFLKFMKFETMSTLSACLRPGQLTSLGSRQAAEQTEVNQRCNIKNEVMPSVVG